VILRSWRNDKQRHEHFTYGWVDKALHGHQLNIELRVTRKETEDALQVRGHFVERDDQACKACSQVGSHSLPAAFELVVSVGFRKGPESGFQAPADAGVKLINGKVSQRREVVDGLCDYLAPSLRVARELDLDGDRKTICVDEEQVQDSRFPQIDLTMDKCYRRIAFRLKKCRCEREKPFQFRLVRVSVWREESDRTRAANCDCHGTYPS
jgi:hypothetical protein